jgi:hypothetical protein
MYTAKATREVNIMRECVVDEIEAHGKDWHRVLLWLGKTKSIDT